MTPVEKIEIARDALAECVEDAGPVENMVVFCLTRFPQGDNVSKNAGIVAGSPADITIALLCAMSRNRAVREIICAAAGTFDDFNKVHGEMIRNK